MTHSLFQDTYLTITYFETMKQGSTWYNLKGQGHEFFGPFIWWKTLLEQTFLYFFKVKYLPFLHVPFFAYILRKSRNFTKLLNYFSLFNRGPGRFFFTIKQGGWKSGDTVPLNNNLDMYCTSVYFGCCNMHTALIQTRIS